MPPINLTAAGVGGVRFIGGTSWICTSNQIYYATRAAGVAAFPAATYPGLVQVWGDVGSGRVRAMSDASRYKPVNGSAVLFANSYGTIATPTLTQAAGSTSFTFNIGTAVIPANTLGAGDQLICKGRYRKNGANATLAAYVTLGTAGTVSDARIWAATSPITDNNDTGWDAYATIGSATGFVSNQSYTQAGTGGVDYLADATTNFNVASAMTLTIGMTKHTSDTVDLLGFSLIWVTAP